MSDSQSRSLGERVRMHRIRAGMSQETLGNVELERIKLTGKSLTPGGWLLEAGEIVESAALFMEIDA